MPNEIQLQWSRPQLRTETFAGVAGLILIMFGFNGAVLS